MGVVIYEEIFDIHIILIFSSPVSAQDLNQINQMDMDDINEIHVDKSYILPNSLNKSFSNLKKKQYLLQQTNLMKK